MKKVFMDVSKSFDEDLKKVDNKTKNGIETLHFEVNEKNEPAIKLYENFGFKNLGIRKNYYKGQFDAYIMKLMIEK